MNTAARKRACILASGTILALAGSAFAAEPAPTQGAEPSKQAREQMAKMHEEMAGCLRSEKSFAQCRAQMHESCMAAMGQKGCPMMGTGMQHRMREPAPADHR